jgi:hypothetical protein
MHPLYPYCASSVSESSFVGLLAENLISKVLLSCYWWLRDVVTSTQRVCKLHVHVHVHVLHSKPQGFITYKAPLLPRIQG